ncbi:MAG: T9SS type A sorting domain-containing protein [Elusimicrobia bacterium]|nr:T9SS type A sorting domain-containing protein [Elusimicrobiota bacterium]
MSLTIGNNVFNPASGQKANIFIPTNLHDITIKIFTITGTLVKKFESISSPNVSWDGKNEVGETVASGVYLVILESLEKTQKTKIIILKWEFP